MYKRPFFVLWIGFIVGVLLEYNLDIDYRIYYYGGIITLFIGSMLLILKKKMSFVILCFFIIMGGYFFKSDYKLDYSNKKENIAIVEKVRKEEEYFSSYILKKDNKNYLLLNIYGNKKLDIGNIVEIKGELETIPKNTNNNLFNLKNYYKSQYVHKKTNLKDRDIEIIKTEKSFYKKNDEFKKYVEKNIDKGIQTKEKTVLKAMITGDKSYIEEEYLDKIRGLGIGHILAISGFHIGLLYGGIYFLLFKILKLNKRIAQIISISSIWLYIGVIEFPVSAVRAGLFISLFILSKLLEMRFDPLNTTGFIGLVLLLYKPLYILDLGYQLSFLGTVFILLGLERNISIYESTFLGMLPINLYYFNNISLFSIVGNLLAVPIISLSFMVSILGIIVSTLSVSISNILYFISEIFLKLFNLIIEVLSHFNLEIVSNTDILLLIGLYIIILIYLKIINIKIFPKKLLKIILIYILIANSIYFFKEENTTKISFLDVGQGDAIIIDINSKIYIIDTGGNMFGNREIGNEIVLPYLEKNKSTNVNKIFISHFHEDHGEGYVQIADKLEVSELILGYENDENPLYRDILEVSKNENILVNTIEEKVKIRVDRNNIFYIYPPKKRFKEDKNENNRSMVILLESFGKKILFTGDIEEVVEREFLKEKDLKDVDIIKVPHHGSKTSSSEIFLDYVEPKLGVIQVGKNSFGHPNSDIIERYKERKIDLMRTDIDGEINITIGRRDFYVNRYNKEKNVPNVEIEEIYMNMGYSLVVFILTVNYLRKEYEFENRL